MEWSFFLIFYGPSLVAAALGVWAAVKWSGWWRVGALLPIAIAWGTIPWAWIIKAIHPEQDPLMAILFPLGGVAGVVAIGLLALVRIAVRAPERRA